jgi:tetratricopeptide (TPR) repeat protein
MKKMKRKCFNRMATLLSVVAFCMFLPARPAAAWGAQQSQQPSYTIPEYNAFQACQTEKDSPGRLSCLDSFSTQFPNSTLMQYVYQLYYQTYFQTKNYPKTIYYADKLVALGGKVDQGSISQALQIRVQAFSLSFDPKAADATDQLTAERDAAMLGAKVLQQLPKPSDPPMTDTEFADKKKPYFAFFYAAAGFADIQLKDYPSAVQAFESALANNPTDAVSEYRLGISLLALNPPQSLDGFWALARAIDEKVPQSDDVQKYLRAKIQAYEQLTCDSLVDAQLSELLQLAANAQERPATYSIPSSADLQKIAGASTILTVMSDLQAGGDKAQMTWLAICGAEFPEVVGKIVDVKKTDSTVDFMVFFGATQEEMQAATTANMDVKVWTSAPPAGGAASQETPQPDVVRLPKDDPIRFSGTLASYDPSPFLLHWDQVKVDPTIIPAEEKHHVVHKPPVQ